MDEELDPETGARRKLKEAINTYLMETGEDTGFLNSWVLVTSESRMYADGSSGTTNSIIIDEHQPIHITVGLFHYAGVRTDAWINSGMRNS